MDPRPVALARAYPISDRVSANGASWDLADARRSDQWISVLGGRQGRRDGGPHSTRDVGAGRASPLRRQPEPTGRRHNLPPVPVPPLRLPLAARRRDDGGRLAWI